MSVYVKIVELPQSLQGGPQLGDAVWSRGGHSSKDVECELIEAGARTTPLRLLRTRTPRHLPARVDARVDRTMCCRSAQMRVGRLNVVDA